MKIRFSELVALTMLFAGFGLHAQEPKKLPQEETELEQKMDVMGGAWRKLKRQVGDATKNADSLQLLAAIRAAAEEAAKLTPVRVADVPASARAGFLADYQAGMKKLLAAFEKLEAALRADKNDDAAKLVAEIGAMQKAGHKEFKRPDEQK